MRFGTAEVVAFVLFGLGLFAAAVGYAADRSVRTADIIVVPFFGEAADTQADPWTVHFSDFMKYGNPLYYWESFTHR